MVEMTTGAQFPTATSEGDLHREFSQDQYETGQVQFETLRANGITNQQNRNDTIIVAGDEDVDFTDHDPDSVKSPSASRRTSVAASSTPVSEPLNSRESPLSSITAGAGSQAYQLNTVSSSIGKHKNQYMVDGRIVNGKGLGRGRPGIKRGPRKSRLATEIVADESFVATAPTPERREFSTSASAQSKRKRRDSESSIVKVDMDSDSSFLDSRSSTPEYNPNAFTRSGRASQRPAPALTLSVDPVLTTSPPITGKPSTQSTPTAMSNGRKHPKIKPKVYRGREAFALCEHCLRGISPPSNPIVFCDACNKCWHQRCHDPRIPPAVLNDSKAEWFCAECDRILHGKKKVTKAETLKAMVGSPHGGPHGTGPDEIRYGQPKLSGIVVTPSYKKKYLQTLSKERLIELVLLASTHAPHLALFESQLQKPAPILNLTPTYTSSYVTPVDPKPYSLATNNAKNNKELHDDEGYEDDGLDEFAILYPKPGEGVQLPPEREDLQMLLEGSDSCTFSHWVRGTERKTTLDVR